MEVQREREDNKSNPVKGLENKKKNTNQEIIIMTYVFLGLIVACLANFAYFIIVDGDEVVNNTYNNRQNLLAERVVRGKILGNNGEVLAETVTNEKKEEVRKYPFKNLFCHVVGNHTKNKSGIELSDNFHLLTSNENPLSTVYNQLSDEKNQGNNLVTTLDVNLQKVIYDALGKKRGAVVAIEPSTGKILAMVSKPDYNPNEIEKTWDKLTTDKNNEAALVNRATQGLYPPGSTFKILTALEYMKENKNYENYSYQCKSSGIFASVKINCYHGSSHGTVDLKKAFAKSCNTAFANIGVGLNQKLFRQLCEDFLYNQELPISIRSKKSSYTLDETSDPSYVPQTVLGQGETQVSPLHSGLIVATIANGGVLMNPYLVDRIEGYAGNVVKRNMPSTYKKIITPEEAKVVTELMKEVVKTGTASKLNNLGFSVAGKTGSAEFNANKESHAWFVGFAPADNPQIVLSIVVEGGGSGSQVAVPIARKILKEYIKEN